MPTLLRKIAPANPIEKTQPAISLPLPNVLAVQLPIAAKMLGCSEITVRRYVRRGLLRPSRAMKRLVFPISELQRFLEST
jgi:hypothetical protein